MHVGNETFVPFQDLSQFTPKSNKESHPRASQSESLMNLAALYVTAHKGKLKRSVKTNRK